MLIRNPVTWVFAQFAAAETIGATPPEQYFVHTHAHTPKLRRISIADVAQALHRGWEDTGTGRAYLVMLGLVYPVMAVYIWASVHYGMLIPLLLPIASGFALVGPLFAVGMYEMSRSFELTGTMSWLDGFKVLRSPSIGGIIGMGFALIALFFGWLALAALIARACLGSVPTGLGAFLAAAFTTTAGWQMLALGTLTGGIFAVLVLVISSVSFPLLLDRPARLGTAIRVSMAAMSLNPIPLLLWGLIVAAGLALGSLPAFIGLIVILPVLGHGTWHLYRAMVPRS